MSARLDNHEFLLSRVIALQATFTDVGPQPMQAQRAVIYCRDGVLRAEHLPSHILTGVAGPTNDPTVKLESAKPKEDSKELGSQIATTERDIIEQALIRNNYNRTRTAKELGVSRVTLYNKMKRYDLS